LNLIPTIHQPKRLQLNQKKDRLNCYETALSDPIGTELELFFGKKPQILSFADEHGNDNMKQVIEANYRQVKLDIVQIVESDMERIKNDPDLQHLVQQE